MPLSPRSSQRFAAPTLGALLRASAFTLAAAAALTAVAPLVALAPEPDPVPRRWQLEIEPGDLRMAIVDVKDPATGATTPKSFLYMTYTVTNNSGQDLLFAPMFELSDGSGKILRAGRDVPQDVTSKLVADTQNPFMKDQIEIIGQFLQGEENARTGLVVWPLASLSPSKLTVYAAGFSGETNTVTSPDGKQQFVLRKTLMMDFDSPGSLQGQGSQAIPLKSKTWIMR